MKKKAKKRLLSRIYMYIFLTLSTLTGIWIAHTYAYADLELCAQTPELVNTSFFINLVVDR
jgi:hypothetical protein